MKRILIAMALLLAVALTAPCLIGAELSAARDRVEITEQALFGDPALAAGATVHQTAQLDEHLLWQTAYPVGGAPSTDYRFSSRGLTFEHLTAYDGIHLSDHIEFGLNLRDPFDAMSGIEVAYYELFQETEPGTRSTKRVRLQDYYTYYPIRIEIDLPGTLWHGLDYERMESDDFVNERLVWDKFSEFFKIPIPENLPDIEISVTKNADGSIGGTGSHMDKAGYALYVEAAYNANTCFFAINNRIGDIGEPNGYIDTSLIPGGYGIYSFSYSNVLNERNSSGSSRTFHPGYQTGVNADSLAMVYPLEQHVSVRDMTVSADGSRLLLLTDDGAAITLTVIDVATMTATQSFRLCDSAYVSIHQEDDFIIFFHNPGFSLFSVDDAGTYRLEITADQPSVTDDDFKYINTHAAMDFDGERLIMVDQLEEERYRAMLTCNFCVAVYDQSGLRYYGEYQSGLSANPDPNDYRYNCLTQEITVTWQ